MTRVLLAADGGPAVGLGHVMRLRSIAQALARARARAPHGSEAEAVLLVEDDEGARRLADAGFPVCLVAADALAAGPFDAALLDGFHTWPALAPVLLAGGTRLVLMENRTALRPRAHAVVYPGLHYAPDAWDLAHPDRVRSGAGWTPLSQELLALSPATAPDIDLLVSFGGSDPAGLTERVLAALPAELPGVSARLAVVLGPHMAARRELIAARLRRFEHGELIERPAGLGPLIARSRVVLTALGTTLAECAWLGVPALVLANYAADAAALEHYARRGPHLPLGVADQLADDELRSALAAGLAAAASRPRESDRELGGGSERIARLLLEA